MVELNEKALEAAEVAWRASVSATCKLMLRDAIRAYLSSLPAPDDGLGEKLNLLADHLLPAVLEYGREIAMLREAAAALQSQTAELQHLRADAANPDKGMWTLWNEKAREQAKQIERLTRAAANPWCPDVCPVTGRRFFMWIDGEPTYGGPLDSYTIPTLGADGEYSCRRYDHDEGGWKDWTEGLSIKVVDESDWLGLEDRLEAAEQQVQKLTAENERLREALTFYADVSKYPAPLTGGMGALWNDCGSTARSALEPQEDGKC